MSIRKDKRVEMQSKRRQKVLEEIGIDSSADGGASNVTAPENVEELRQLVNNIHNQDSNVRLQSVIAIRKLLSSEGRPPIDEVRKI